MYKFWLIIKFSSSLFCCLNFCENILESSKAFCVGLSVNHLRNFHPPCFRGHRARDLLHALLHSSLLRGAPGINIFPIFLLRGNDGLLLDCCSSFLCLCIRILLRFLAQFFLRASRLRRGCCFGFLLFERFRSVLLSQCNSLLNIHPALVVAGRELLDRGDQLRSFFGAPFSLFLNLNLFRFLLLILFSEGLFLRTCCVSLLIKSFHDLVPCCFVFLQRCIRGFDHGVDHELELCSLLEGPCDRALNPELVVLPGLGIFSMHSYSSTLSCFLKAMSFILFSALASPSTDALARASAAIFSSASRIFLVWSSRYLFFSLNFSSLASSLAAPASASSLMIMGWCFLAISTNLINLARSSLKYFYWPFLFSFSMYRLS